MTTKGHHSITLFDSHDENFQLKHCIRLILESKEVFWGYKLM